MKGRWTRQKAGEDIRENQKPGKVKQTFCERWTIGRISSIRDIRETTRASLLSEL